MGCPEVVTRYVDMAFAVAQIQIENGSKSRFRNFRCVMDTSDGIAIIGMGCRLPGGVSEPNDFWQLLMGRREGVREIPPDRWDVDALHDPVPGKQGKITPRQIGTIDGI